MDKKDKKNIGRGQRVYVAGPVNGSGRQHENAHRALEVAELLRDHGFMPFVPHLNWLWHFMYPDRSEEEILEWCDSWVRACNFVVRLPGMSPGSDHECDVARTERIPIFTNDGTIGDHLVGARKLIEFCKRNETMDMGPKLRAEIAVQSRRDVEWSEFHVFQLQVLDWLKRQPFHPQKAHHPLLGIGEEVGELMHSHLKNEQNIRGSSAQHRAGKIDAIGDILVYLAGYCIAEDLDLGECVKRAWNEVRERDWNKNRETGAVRTDGPDGPPLVHNGPQLPLWPLKMPSPYSMHGAEVTPVLVRDDDGS